MNGRKWFVLAGVVILAALSAGVAVADELPNPKGTQPAYPAKLEWDLKIAPDTLFYQLASDVRVTDKNPVSWTVPTLGFRDFRIVLFLTGSERTSKVVTTAVKLTLSTKDGDKEFDYFKKDIAIDTGRTDGEAVSTSVYGESVTVKVEPKNLNGNLHLSVYLLK